MDSSDLSSSLPSSPSRCKVVCPCCKCRCEADSSGAIFVGSWPFTYSSVQFYPGRPNPAHPIFKAIASPFPGFGFCMDALIAACCLYIPLWYLRAPCDRLQFSQRPTTLYLKNASFFDHFFLLHSLAGKSLSHRISFSFSSFLFSYARALKRHALS